MFLNTKCGTINDKSIEYIIIETNSRNIKPHKYIYLNQDEEKLFKIISNKKFLFKRDANGSLLSSIG